MSFNIPKTLVADVPYVAETRAGLYTIQLAQPLTGSETVTVSGGGFDIHVFDVSSIGDLSGITLNVALPETTLTASGNASPVLVAFERVIFQ
jgi:hypothetical protein